MSDSHSVSVKYAFRGLCMQKICVSIALMHILRGICPFMHMNKSFSCKIDQMLEEPDSIQLCSASCLQKSLAIREAAAT